MLVFNFPLKKNVKLRLVEHFLSTLDSLFFIIIHNVLILQVLFSNYLVFLIYAD